MRRKPFTGSYKEYYIGSEFAILVRNFRISTKKDLCGQSGMLQPYTSSAEAANLRSHFVSQSRDHISYSPRVNASNVYPTSSITLQLISYAENTMANSSRITLQSSTPDDPVIRQCRTCDML